MTRNSQLRHAEVRNALDRGSVLVRGGPARARLAAAAAGAAVFALAWRFLGFAGFNNDHYVHVARGYQMLLGEWPVRDFVDPGMPLMYAISAAGRVLLGPALGTEWLVVAGAFAIGAACTVVAAARLSQSVGIGLLVAALGVMMNPRSFGYPKVLMYAGAALAFIYAASRPTGRRLADRSVAPNENLASGIGPHGGPERAERARHILAAGQGRDSARIGPSGASSWLALMTAVAFLFRHDHGLFVGLGALAVTMMASHEGGWRGAARRAGMLIGWTALVLAPWALFVQAHGGLDGYFASALAFSRGEAREAGIRELPRIDLLQPGTQGNALAGLFYLFHLLPLACLAIVSRRRLLRIPDAWPGETSVVAAIALMAIPMNVTFLRAGLDARIPDAFVPAGLLGAWLLAPRPDGLGRPARQWWRGPSQVRVATVVAVLITVAAVVRAADVREQVGRTEVLDGWDGVRERTEDLWIRLHRRLPDGDLLPSRYSGAMLPFIEYVNRCTTRQDRLLMTGLYPEVYVMADRGFAGGHQSFRPGFYTSDADQQRMMARLERQSVPFVIVVKDEASALRAEMPRLAGFIDRHYRPLAFVPVFETQGVEIYLDTRRVPVRGDPGTGWPCFV